MATTRRISTRIAIEGDAQYKQSLTQINSELRKLGSALKLTESEYQNNANSINALTAKSKALMNLQQKQNEKIKAISAAYANAQSSVKTYEQRNIELIKSIEKNQKQLEKLEKTEADTTAGKKALTDATKLLQNELVDNEARLKAAQGGVNNYENSLNHAKIQLNNTNVALQKNEQCIEEAKKSTDGCATSIDKFGKEVSVSKEKVASLSEALVAAGIIAGLKKLAELFIACAKASIEFESAITGIKKTTDLSNKEIQQMAGALQKLSLEIPMTANELAGIAESAGQLGIAKENLVSFTGVMADLGAATNLSGETAAQTFAKFANITGMAQTDFERLGSAVVDLGNNLATNEADIAAMALSLSAAGTQAGMSEAQIVGLAGALSSLGLEAQAGGTAFSKTLNMMKVQVETNGEKLQDFARVAGMSADEFARAFKDDAAGALAAFTQGLNNVETHGKSTVVLLEELGLTEVRMRDALTRVASSGDLLTSSMARSTKAWKENTALTREAELRYATTESKIKMLSNATEKLKVAVGDQLSPAIGKLSAGFTKLLDGLSNIISEDKEIIPLIAGASAALVALIAAVTAYTIGAKIAAAVTAIFAAAQAALPLIGVAVAVVGLVTALGLLGASYDDGIIKTEELTAKSQQAVDTLSEIDAKCKDTSTSAEASAVAAERYADMLDELSSSGKMSNIEQVRYEQIVGELNTIVPNLNASIDEQTGLIKGGTGALRENITAWKNQAKQQGQMEALTEKYKAAGIAQIEYAENSNLASVKQKEHDEAVRKHSEALAEYEEITRKAADGTLSLADGQKSSIEAIDALNLRYNELAESLPSLADNVGNTKKQLEEADAAVVISAENYALLTGEADSYSKTLEALMDENANSIPGWNEMSQAQQDQIVSSQRVREEQDRLKESYNQTYEEARKSIHAQIGLFDEFTAESTLSTTKMVKAWGEQTKNLNTYNENLATASKYLNKDIVVAWGDGTTESAGYLQAFTGELETMIKAHGEESEAVRAFVDDFNAAYENTIIGKDTVAETNAKIREDFQNTKDAVAEKVDDTVDEINTSYEDTNIGKDTVAETNAKIREDFQNTKDAVAEKADEMVKAMNKADEAFAAASETGASYARGLLSQVDAVYAAAQHLAEQANAAWKATYKQRSPSKVAIATAAETGEGYVMGLASKHDKLMKTGKDLAQAANDGYVAEVHGQMAQAKSAVYNAPTNYGGNTFKNHATITINTKTITDAEVNRVVDTINKTFGSKMTLNVRRANA